MTAELWIEIRALVEAAVTLPANERPAYLAAHGLCAEVRVEAAKLLAFEERAEDLFGAEGQPFRFDHMDDTAIEDPGHTGQIIGSYRLVEPIGRGGMGAVYRAVRMDDAFEKSVAIKLIDASLHSSDVVANFRRERQILANLEHPNIARLLDGGTRPDGLPYLIMEYVAGISPYDYCREHNLSLTQRLHLFREICAAVHYAHQNMVIHRDLKPANILVMADGIPKLLDFGIAKVFRPEAAGSTDVLTAPAMQRMTVRYASPEQIRGEPVSTASDVYSLGVILYELLADHSPYGSNDRPTHQMMAAVCDEVPTRPSNWSARLRGDLDNIILHALRKGPAERYASVDAFSDDIRRFLEGRPVLARGEAPLYVAAKFIHRNRVLVTAAALLLCTLVGSLIEVSLARRRADRRFNQVRQLAHSVMFDYADAIDRLPGSTPVRARLVSDALTYLDNLSREADTPQLQQEIVNAYVRVSDVQGNEYENNLGDTAGAMASAHKAVSAAEKLLAENKGIGAEDAAAGAFSTQGSLAYSAGDLAAADTAYQRVLALRRDIAAKSPDDIANRIALSTCLRHMGDLYGGASFQNLGKTNEAMVFYTQAKELDQELSAQHPGDTEVTKDNYKTLMSLSGAEASVGKHQEAIADLTASLASIGRAAALEPRDTNVRMELAVGQSRLGQMLLDARNFSAAVQAFTESAAQLDRLLKDDAGNATYRRGQSVVQAQWAAALRGTGQVPASLPHNVAALQMSTDLHRETPASAQYRVDVGINERKLSEGLLANGNAAAALRYAEQAREDFCGSSALPTDSNMLANCDRSLVAEGRALLAEGNAAAAVTAMRRGEGIAAARAHADPGSAIFASDWARSQAALAEALAAAGDREAARESYSAALATWNTLREKHSLTTEDDFRSAASARSFAVLKPK